MNIWSYQRKLHWSAWVYSKVKWPLLFFKKSHQTTFSWSKFCLTQHICINLLMLQWMAWTAKQFMKRKFVDWYARQIVTEINKARDVEEIDVPMKLSIMKPLHASWLMELYNYMTLSAGRDVCMKGLEKN